MKTKKHIFAILIFILIIVGILAGYFRSFQNTQSIDDQKMYTLDEYQEKFDHSKWKDLQKNRPIPGRFFNSKIGGATLYWTPLLLYLRRFLFQKEKQAVWSILPKARFISTITWILNGSEWSCPVCEMYLKSGFTEMRKGINKYFKW